MPIAPQTRRQASQTLNTTQTEDDGDDVSDMRSALDRTIDRIGMGPYQWALLALCGFGWAADNMWMQAITIILPRVQDEYAVPDSQIGFLSTSVFFGMMFGALGWGSCSDVVGRRMAFNLTLAFTGLFGVLACFASSFRSLCFFLFLLGTAVGGSMPTDGTLFLENVPKRKQYLLTGLSLFFSLGSVVNAVIAILVIPGNSCPEAVSVTSGRSGTSFLGLARTLVSSDSHDTTRDESKKAPPCDIETQNRGWKYLLVILGIITIVMFVLRIIFFRLYESPRYLVANGRSAEAVAALQSIEDYNMKYTRKRTRPRLVITLSDVCDTKPSVMEGEECVLSGAGDDEEAMLSSSPRSEGATNENKVQTPDSDKENGRSQALAQQVADPADYQSTEVTPEGVVSREWSFHTPGLPRGEDSGSYFEGKQTPALSDEEAAPSRSSRSRSRLAQARRPQMPPRSRSSIYVEQTLPPTIGRPVAVWLDRVGMLFTRKWWLTTTLIWLAWWGISLAYTMYNVYLPKLLEQRLGATGSEGSSRLEALRDMVVFSIASCPGALLGAWMVESPLGRRKSLALSLLVTAGFCYAFTQVNSKFGVMWSTTGVSLATTVMWAVLYGMTPEIFDTKVRGTACGIASALNRVGGMIGPILGGILIGSSTSLPVYTAICIFMFSAVCVLLLPFEKTPDEGEGEGEDGRGEYSVLH
ncbi:hypothetical protein FRC08_002103 [Ceratobasidium sp. 394]|nr:hypothetical protein FRC08_002103 [Ceratobasidium sp. 394]